MLGNHDPSTFSGKSANMTLDYILRLNNDKNNVFYNKVDVNNIGITGHSQGGVGVFNAIQNEKYSNIYKCAVSISPTERELAKAINIPYECSNVSIPVMLLAREENDVISIKKMQEMYNEIDNEKIMMIKSNTNHGEMLYSADGYVTAYFMWKLQNDSYAKEAFVKDNGEIYNNKLYQNVESNILNY